MKTSFKLVVLLVCVFPISGFGQYQGGNGNGSSSQSAYYIGLDGHIHGAKELVFINQPDSFIQANSDFEVELAILDSNGLVLTKGNIVVTLSVAGGLGSLIGSVTKSSLNGYVTFTNIHLFEPDEYRLVANGVNLSQVVSNGFVVVQHIYRGGNGGGSSFSEVNSEPLPINLLRFYSLCDFDGLRLLWTTSSEINNDFFTIQYSQNMKDWVDHISIKGNGNTNNIHYYNCEIKTEIVESNMYFRLLQTDFDGKSSILDVLTCLPCNENSSQKFYIQPNPCTSNLNLFVEDLTFNSSFEGLAIFDSYGKELFYSSVPVTCIPIGHLDTGHYLLVIKLKSNEVRIEKFIKIQ